MEEEYNQIIGYRRQYSALEMLLYFQYYCLHF